MIEPPEQTLRTCVVVPAKDEAERIGRCIAALGEQSGVPADAYEVIVVLDRCSDDTGERARAAATPSLRLHLVHAHGDGVGHARRAGMELACNRLLALDRPRALVASTDADTVVDRDWLAAQLALVDRGAEAIGGRIELLATEAALLPAAALSRRRASLHQRHRRARASGAADAEHGHFSGASMSLTARAYAYVGGLEPRVALEDEALERALQRHGVPIVRSNAVRVRTSARTAGRAPLGLAHDLARAVHAAR